MLIDFNETKEITIPGMNGGTGTMSARMFMDEQGSVLQERLLFQCEHNQDTGRYATSSNA